MLETTIGELFRRTVRYYAGRVAVKQGARALTYADRMPLLVCDVIVEAFRAGFGAWQAIWGDRPSSCGPVPSTSCATSRRPRRGS